jgi:regulator of protease activity HflC (stomatin/prohibitin superfamily)
MADKEHDAVPTSDDQGAPGSSASGPDHPEGPHDLEAAEAGARALSAALKGSFRMLKWAMIALAFFYFLSGLFYVHQQEIKFKLRFGRIVPSWGEYALKPGRWHIRWPWEEVQTVSTEEKALTIDDQFWTEYPEGPANRRTSLRVQDDGFLITGDVNIVHMQLRARYRVSNSAQGAMSYLFGVEDAEGILRRELLASTVKVVGSMDVMDVLRRQNLFERIKNELAARVAKFEKRAGIPLGLDVVAVEATGGEKKNPTEPQPVRDAFTKAQNASSLRQQLEKEGELEAISIREDAKAKAEETLAAAQGDKERLVQTAQADAEAMQKLLPSYQQSSGEAAILRESFFERTMDTVMGAAHGIFVLYENPSRELRLLLTTEPPAPVEPPKTEK